MIWLSSDLHFCHNKDFIYERRGFHSIQEMDEAIVRNFNEAVAWDDDLYILGDIMLNDNDKGIRLLRQLPGNIHILIGNHDTSSRVELYRQEPRIIVEGYATVLKYQKYNFYLCHYPTLTANLDDDKSLTKRPLCLAGHTHSTKLFEPCGSYNVALDAHENYPVAIDQIIYDLKYKEKKK